MGAGGSVLSPNDSEKVLEYVRSKYRVSPVETTQIVKMCSKEVKKLNKERQMNLFKYPNDTEMEKRFILMDVNSNGIVSLAEIDKYIVELNPEYNNKPALMRAYHAADLNNDGFVNRKEYLDLWKYIAYFNTLWHKFEELDDNNDRRISYDEFYQLSGKLFDTILNEKEAKYIFNLMDQDHHGMVLFKEFCGFMVRRKIALE